uniref:Uncharacterized protein n=2 Tax=unclassified Kuttervirus TaxID=2770329 RepID=A0AAU8GHQ8_9CAUD
MFMHKKIHKHICSWSVGGYLPSHIPPGFGSDLSLNQGAGNFKSILRFCIRAVAKSYCFSRYGLIVCCVQPRSLNPLSRLCMISSCMPVCAPHGNALLWVFGLHRSLTTGVYFSRAFHLQVLTIQGYGLSRSGWTQL